MKIVSVAFAVFFALTAGCYFLVKKEWKWIILLIASYVFFYMNSKWLLVALFFATAVSFFAALGIHKINQDSKKYLAAHPELTSKEKKAYKERTKKKAKVLLITGIVLVLSVLLFLK